MSGTLRWPELAQTQVEEATVKNVHPLTQRIDPRSPAAPTISLDDCCVDGNASDDVCEFDVDTHIYLFIWTSFFL